MSQRAQLAREVLMTMALRKRRGRYSTRSCENSRRIYMPFKNRGLRSSGDGLRVFIAGPLFSQAEREFNLKVDEYLRRRGFETFLPQRDVGKLDELLRRKGKRAYREIFEQDLEGIERADVVAAILDGPDVDSGTAFEVGYAFARGKPVLGLKTDMRVFAKGEELNNMLAQAVRALARSLEELVEELRKLG